MPSPTCPKCGNNGFSFDSSPVPGFHFILCLNCGNPVGVSHDSITRIFNMQLQQNRTLNAIAGKLGLRSDLPEGG